MKRPYPSRITTTDHSGHHPPSLPGNEATDLPPHSLEAERGALGCVLLTQSTAEADSLLLQLRSRLFFDLRHRTLHDELVQLRFENHAVDLVVIGNWLKGRNKIEACGGVHYISEHGEQTPSVANFSYYLAILEDKHLRRQTMARAARMAELAAAEGLTMEQLKTEFSELLESVERSATAGAPLIQLWTIAEAKAYRPDPSTFLIGADMVTRGDLTVIAGPPGVGKSRLANTLAFTGARGTGTWMGYEIKRRFRTLILQSENNPRRIQSEVAGLPAELNDFVRISLPCFMDFGNPAFRAELRRIFDRWPFDVLVIDNMTDVAKADSREDFIEALDSIRASLPVHPHTPAIILLAHLRKARGGEQWRPKRGRELLDELSGSFALGAKARTAFVLQPASSDHDDDRVIFDCGKSNNDVPLPMSCWFRRNGEFQPCPDFDFDQWLSGDDAGRKVISEAMMADLFRKHGPAIEKPDMVKLLTQAEGFSQATAYRALRLDGKFADHLWETPMGLLAWK